MRQSSFHHYLSNLCCPMVVCHGIATATMDNLIRNKMTAILGMCAVLNGNLGLNGRKLFIVYILYPTMTLWNILWVIYQTNFDLHNHVSFCTSFDIKVLKKKQNTNIQTFIFCFTEVEASSVLLYYGTGYGWVNSFWMNAVQYFIRQKVCMLLTSAGSQSHTTPVGESGSQGRAGSCSCSR